MASDKARSWVAVMYPENMVEDWETNIGDYLEVSGVYCIHDKDTDTVSEKRKVHAHIMITFSNTTTRNNATRLFAKLNAEGKQAIAGGQIQPVANVRHMYEYLIHNTEACEKQRDKKVLYSKDERIEFNGFDIGLLEQLSQDDVKRMRREMFALMREKKITNYADFVDYVEDELGIEYVDLIMNSASSMGLYIKGQYHRVKDKEEKEAAERQKRLQELRIQEILESQKNRQPSDAELILENFGKETENNNNKEE